MFVIDHYYIMDILSCIFILLIIIILGFFIRFLVRLYKDRGRLAFQVIKKALILIVQHCEIVKP